MRVPGAAANARTMTTLETDSPTTPATQHEALQRRRGRAVGGLYLAGNAFGVASAAALGVLTGAESIGAASVNHPWAAPAAALAIMLMGVALAFMPVVAYPVMAAISPLAARSYVLLRSVIELGTYALAAASVAMVAPLTGVVDDAVLTALAQHGPLTALIAVGFIGSALVFYSTLWRGRAAPRWILGWGLLATVLYLVGEGLVLFGVAEPSAPSVVGLLAALALQEMVLAAWLLWKGFSLPIADPGEGDRRP